MTSLSALSPSSKAFTSLDHVAQVAEKTLGEGYKPGNTCTNGQGIHCEESAE